MKSSSFAHSTSFKVLRSISHGTKRRKLDEIYEEYVLNERELDKLGNLRVDFFHGIQRGRVNPRNDLTMEGAKRELHLIGDRTRETYSRQNELRQEYEEIYEERMGKGERDINI